jgi:hypothetical protein
LPKVAWEPVIWRRALVHRDTHIAFDKRLYSVPWKHLGQPVWLRASKQSVVIYANDERVATHDRGGKGYRSTIESHLPDHRGALRHRSRAYWEERASALGSEVAEYVTLIFDSDDVLSQLRTVQAVVTHLETFPQQRARAACRRAAHFGAYTYGALKKILRQGLDLEPLPAEATTQVRLPTPRFARPATLWRH